MNVPRSGSDQWERHWQDYAQSAEVNPAQSYRRRLIANSLGIADGGQGARILDIGCGTGDQLRDLAARFPRASLVGVDVSKRALEVTHRKVPGAGLAQFNLQGDGELPAGLGGWATHAVCTEVLEHLEDPLAALTHARRMLDPEGRLVVTVPGGPMSAFDKYIGHLRHFDAPMLRGLLRQAGFSSAGVEAAGFPAFNLYRSMVLLRGERLIDDAVGRPSPMARAAMLLFDGLLRFAVLPSPWGWQIIGVARIIEGD